MNQKKHGAREFLPYHTTITKNSQGIHSYEPLINNQ